MLNKIGLFSIIDTGHFPDTAEYASVGYMAKRIQMRKNRFLALQKMAEQKKNEAMVAAAAAAAAQVRLRDMLYFKT